MTKGVELSRSGNNNNVCLYLNLSKEPDMKNGVGLKILTDCGNFTLVALNFSLLNFIKLKDYGKFTWSFNYTFETS